MPPTKYPGIETSTEKEWFEEPSNSDFSPFAGVRAKSPKDWINLENIIAEVTGLSVIELQNVLHQVLKTVDLGPKAGQKRARTSWDTITEVQTKICRKLEEERARRSLGTGTQAKPYATWIKKAVQSYVRRAITLYKTRSRKRKVVASQERRPERSTSHQANTKVNVDDAKLGKSVHKVASDKAQGPLLFPGIDSDHEAEWFKQMRNSDFSAWEKADPNNKKAWSSLEKLITDVTGPTSPTLKQIIGKHLNEVKVNEKGKVEDETRSRVSLSVHRELLDSGAGDRIKAFSVWLQTVIPVLMTRELHKYEERVKNQREAKDNYVELEPLQSAPSSTRTPATSHNQHSQPVYNMQNSVPAAVPSSANTNISTIKVELRSSNQSLADPPHQIQFVAAMVIVDPKSRTEYRDKGRLNISLFDLNFNAFMNVIKQPPLLYHAGRDELGWYQPNVAIQHSYIAIKDEMGFQNALCMQNLAQPGALVLHVLRKPNLPIIPEYGSREPRGGVSPELQYSVREPQGAVSPKIQQGVRELEPRRSQRAYRPPRACSYVPASPPADPGSQSWGIFGYEGKR